MTIAEIFDVIFAVAVICELGEQSSGIFSTLDEKINEIDWHLYPIEIQRMLPTIMILSQKPMFVTLFGSTSVTRETFKRVSMP